PTPSRDYHMDYQGYGDIAYNFLIGSDGRVYEGRGWTVRGTHTLNFNTNSVGIAFIGNFNEIQPNKKMISAVLNLINCGVRKGYLTPIREIYGHRDVGCTESPGKNLYREIRKWPNYKGGRMPYYTC
ncbi:peptidoglycan-recognition protein SC2-like, partial [Stegodyphus dumicola]|uniref:peptidoglycan-recognition protein SC2-like n=1 Tax=Stegodyphus dumicola TaxID=202533 RepID=UPI0015ABF3C6